MKLEDCVEQLALRNDVLSLCAVDHFKRLHGQMVVDGEYIAYLKEENEKLKGLLKNHGISIRATDFGERYDDR